MNLGYILFSPNGRIGPGAFWRGFIVLVGTGVVLSILGAYGPGIVQTVAGLLSIAIIYPYICVFGKRLHDSGKSAWLWLAFVFGYIVINQILATFLLPLFPGMTEVIAEIEARMTDMMESGAFDFAQFMELMSDQARQTLIPSIVLSVIASLITGFFAARMFSYPEANQYGPPPGGVVDGPNDDFL